MKDAEAKRRVYQTSSEDLVNFVGCENALEFEDLHTRLAEQWLPNGPDEEDVVRTMAKSIFLKRFFSTKRIHLRGTKETAELNQLVVLFERRATADEFENALDSLSGGGFLRWRVPRQKFGSDAAWIEAPREEILDSFIPQNAELRLQEEQQLCAPAQKVSDEALGRELAYEKLLDEVFDHATARLVRIKSAKRMTTFREVQRFDRTHPNRLGHIVR